MSEERLGDNWSGQGLEQRSNLYEDFGDGWLTTPWWKGHEDLTCYRCSLRKIARVEVM